MMKKILFAGLLSIICFCAVQAQNKTLAFNQVLLINSTPQTVPVGKVWKVEGVAGQRVIQYQFASNSNTDYNPANCLITINGAGISVLQTVATGAGNGNGNGGLGYSGFAYAASPTTFPLWLPEGTSLAASTNVSYISVVEFNVVNP
jgi:hypothetical protein